MRQPFFDCTDVGNAERLAHYFGDKFRYVTKWKTFIVWTGTHWDVDDGAIGMGRLAKAVTGKIGEEAKEAKSKEPQEGNKRKTSRSASLFAWKKASRAKNRLDAMIALSRSEDGIAIDHRDLDKNHWLFACKSGTIDLKTRAASQARAARSNHTHLTCEVQTARHSKEVREVSCRRPP